MADAPDKYSLVAEFDKTIITIAGGFLAFTATFHSTAAKDGETPVLVVLSWICAIIAMLLAIFSIALLATAVRTEEKHRAAANVGNPPSNPLPSTVPSFVILNNVAWFAILIAAILFIAAAIWPERHETNDESLRAVKTAAGYVARIDSTAAGVLNLREIARNPATERWDVRFLHRNDTILVAVEPKTMKIVTFRRTAGR